MLYTDLENSDKMDQFLKKKTLTLKISQYEVNHLMSLIAGKYIEVKFKTLTWPLWAPHTSE